MPSQYLIKCMQEKASLSELCTRAQRAQCAEMPLCSKMPVEGLLLGACRSPPHRAASTPPRALGNCSALP